MTLAKLILRLLARAVRQPNGCLVTATKGRYLTVNYDGRRERAHRAVWEFHNGPIPEGMDVCHNCPGGDNSRCIENTHLLCATHAWNMADRDRKGRNGTLGEASPLAKLTADNVLSIYALVKDGKGLKEASIRFNVSEITVWRIYQRTTWKHLLCV